MSQFRGQGFRLFAAAVCTTGATLLAAEIPGLIGRATLTSRDLDYELHAAAATADGRQLAVIAAAKPKGERAGLETLVLATVDDKNQVSQSPLDLASGSAAPPAAQPSGTRLIADAVAFMARGQLLLAVSGRAAANVLFAIDPSSKGVGAARALPLPGTDLAVHELVTLSDGRTLALGISVDGVFAGELSDKGGFAWQKKLRAETAWVEAAAPTRKGGAVVLARRAVSGTTPNEIWIAEISGKGDVLREATLQARSGSVAALADGSYALVTSHPGARGFDVTLRGLGADMKEKWTKPLVTDQVNPAFAVVSGPREDFIVAGTRNRGLWVARYTSDGRQVWSEERPPQPPEVEMVYNLRLLAAGETVFLPYTAYTLDGRQQRQSVRVLKFSMK